MADETRLKTLEPEERKRELDRLARGGGEMPSGLELEEQFFFLSIRALCKMTRLKMIPDEVARREYRKIERKYSMAMLYKAGERERGRRETAAVEALMQEVREGGCPKCREAMDILFGLVKR